MEVSKWREQREGGRCCSKQKDRHHTVLKSIQRHSTCIIKIFLSHSLPHPHLLTWNSRSQKAVLLGPPPELHPLAKSDPLSSSCSSPLPNRYWDQPSQNWDRHAVLTGRGRLHFPNHNYGDKSDTHTQIRERKQSKKRKEKEGENWRTEGEIDAARKQRMMTTMMRKKRKKQKMLLLSSPAVEHKKKKKMMMMMMCADEAKNNHEDTAWCCWESFYWSSLVWLLFLLIWQSQTAIAVTGVLQCDSPWQRRANRSQRREDRASAQQQMYQHKRRYWKQEDRESEKTRKTREGNMRDNEDIKEEGKKKKKMMMMMMMMMMMIMMMRRRKMLLIKISKLRKRKSISKKRCHISSQDINQIHTNNEDPSNFQSKGGNYKNNQHTTTVETTTI